MADEGASATEETKVISPKRSRRSSRDVESPGGSKAERQASQGRRRRTRTPRVPPPDLPGVELTEEEFLKEWGLTKDQEVSWVCD